MEWYEPEVRALEARLRASPPPERPVVFYGSSSVRLWETLAADFPDLPVLNLGFGGSTLAACAHFFARLVPPCRPRSIVFYAGDNDLGDGLPPEHVLRSLQWLRAQVQAALPEARFVFLAIKPSPARWGIRERIDSANRLVRAELAGWPAASFLDIAPAMLGPDGLPRAELFAEDGLHLSPAGYRLWKNLLDAARATFV